MGELIPFQDMERMAEVVAKSRMFGFKSQDEALAIMLLCQGENLHPAIAMRDYHVISGRPALKADAMLARFQAAGGSVKWDEYTDKKVTGTFSHPNGGSVPITWSWDMAVRLGFDKKENWRNYPRAMMRARCISEGIRTVYPGCIAGLYTPEEVQDFVPPAREVVAEEVPNTTSLHYIYLPSGDVYFSHADQQRVKQEYFDLLNKINNNGKLDDEQKSEKTNALAAVNRHLFGDAE